MTVEIIHADCMTVDFNFLATCDVQISDPPFSEHVHANMRSTRTIASGGPTVRDCAFAPLTPELREFLCLVASQMRRWSVIHSDWQGAHLWDHDMAAAGVEPIRWTPWVRWAQPQISGDRPCQGSEAILVYHAMTPPGPRGGSPKPIAKHWNGAGNVIDWGDEPDFPIAYGYRSLRGKNGVDKGDSEKPLDLMLALVSAFSDPGETVLDCTARRGSTALACRLLGRNCVAIEIDGAEAAIAYQRVKSPLSKRDHDRAEEWVATTIAEAETVPEPEDESQVPTWARAQRRIEDAERVSGAI